MHPTATSAERPPAPAAPPSLPVRLPFAVLREAYRRASLHGRKIPDSWEWSHALHAVLADPAFAERRRLAELRDQIHACDYDINEGAVRVANARDHLDSAVAALERRHLVRDVLIDEALRLETAIVSTTP
jgi:hypothetical protein